jgi:hypothetical protein
LFWSQKNDLGFYLNSLYCWLCILGIEIFDEPIPTGDGKDIFWLGELSQDLQFISFSQNIAKSMHQKAKDFLKNSRIGGREGLFGPWASLGSA